MKTFIKLFICLFTLSGLGRLQAEEQLIETVPSLTLKGAKVIAAAAMAEAKANNWNVVIAICDSAGHLKYLERMEDVQIGSLEVAQEKARTSAMFRRPSKAFNDRIKDGDNAVVALPNVLPFEGGIEITIEGVTIGGVGVSGVRSDEDAQIAQAGVDALMRQLRKK